nr:protein ACCELERATED CELL DEATH 6-like isoform X1 [Lolium perenne]
MRGETALHSAIRQRKIDIVILLLMEDSQLARIPSEGMSPLYLAVMLQEFYIAIILHDKDNQLSYSGPDGQNVLHVSVLKSREMSELVLSWNKELAKKQCDNGSTPLHSHLSRADFMVQILLESELSAAYQPNGSGSFPIHIAASKGRLEAVTILLKMCPDCVQLCDIMGRTFLHVAVENRRYNVVSYACRTPSVAPILNTQDNNGNTILHLAVQAGDLSMVCSLLRELQVQLSIPNNSGRTPLDVAWYTTRRGISYHGNPQVIIRKSLGFAGATYGCYGASLLDEQAIFQPDNDRQSEEMKDSTQTLGIGSVLIATVAFGATFALPGGYRADDHPNGGTPMLAGRYVFDAFIMATTLAFVCASVATAALMFSGMAMVDLAIRKKHFQLSTGFAASSVTSLGASFALGLYVVLAPVAHSTAIAVLVVTFAAMVIGILEPLGTLKIIRALCPRLGKGIWRIVARLIVVVVLPAFLPFIIIFGWPAYSVKYRHN